MSGRILLIVLLLFAPFGFAVENLTRTEVESESKLHPALSFTLGGYGETQVLGLKMAIPIFSIVSWRFGTFFSERAGLDQPGTVGPVYGLGWTSDLMFSFPILIKDMIRPYLVSELNGARESNPTGSSIGWSGRLGMDLRLTQHYTTFFEMGACAGLWRQDNVRPLTGAALVVGSTYHWN